MRRSVEHHGVTYAWEGVSAQEYHLINLRACRDDQVTWEKGQVINNAALEALCRDPVTYFSLEIL